MNFAESRAYLTAALTFGIRLGLERMVRLLDLLDHPEQQMQVIHIAGTNGKGSTTAYCAAILAADGQRVGVYTSPYIERFTERIRVIEGREGLAELAANETAGEIDPDHFAEIMTRIRMAVDTMLAEGLEHPTEFELITAAAFVYFHQMQCDRVVLETGLGGRLDSTNVISRPERVIITALGYDHQDRLGNSLAEIAFEKAGIIKAGCPVILYDPLAACPEIPEEAAAAFRVIEDRCQALGAPLTIVSPDQVQSLDYNLSGQTFQFSGETYSTRLLGLFQPLNASLALLACQDLASSDACAVGIREARWPARLEVFPGQPLVLIDGAHNPQGCRALGDALDRLLPGRPIVFLVGLLADKDYPAMLQSLWQNRQFKIQTVLCVTPDNPRALPASDLAQVIRELKTDPACGYNTLDTIRSIDQPALGLAEALSTAASSSAALCAFGSLYLVGHLRAWIKNANG